MLINVHVQLMLAMSLMLTATSVAEPSSEDVRDPDDESDEVDSDCSQRHLMTECWLGLREDVHDLDMDSYTFETFISKF